MRDKHVMVKQKIYNHYRGQLGDKIKKIEL